MLARDGAGLKREGTMTDEQVDPNGKGAILAALLSVMEDVAYIQKDRRNESQKFNYASERAIKEAFHDAFLKAGIIFQLEATGPATVVTSERTTNQGEVKTDSFIQVPFRYTFWHVSGQSLPGTFIGTGNAMNDKGVYAAITGALKYALTSISLTATGDDAEDDGSDAKATPGSTTRPVTKSDLAPKAPTGEMACPKCGKKDSIIKGREEYGGGYVCYKKKNDGCGFQGDEDTFRMPRFDVPKEVKARLDTKRPVPVGGDDPPPPDDDDLR
jgi:hypothetical protein